MSEADDSEWILRRSRRAESTISNQSSRGSFLIAENRDIPFKIPAVTDLQAKNSPSPAESDEEELPRSRSSTDINFAVPLGELDASLYSDADLDDLLEYPTDHKGRLWYTLHYDIELERLQIGIVKARNLPHDRKNKQSFDCFIKVCLLPDERRTVQTKTKRKTFEPHFDERFGFHVSQKQLEERCVRFSLYQTLRRSAQPVSHIHVTLVDIIQKLDDTATRPPKVYNSDFTTSPKKILGTDKGQILLSLNYNISRQRLFIGILKTQDLKTSSIAVDTYVKVELAILNKTTRSKKSSTCKKNEAPVYNESIKFSLPEEGVENAAITISVIQCSSQHEKDKCLGRVVLGSYMIAKGKELEHYQTMLQKPDEEHMCWHDLS